MPQPKKDVNRVEKMNSFIQQELGPILLDYLDKSLGLVTISKVECSGDLRWAKVWISILGPSDEKVIANIQKNIYDIQGDLNKKMVKKITPRLQFFLDTSPRYVQHVDELIKKIHEDEE